MEALQWNSIGHRRHAAIATCRACVIVAACMLVAGTASGDPVEFHAFLLPAESEIRVDEIAEVSFEVDSTAQQFNGYEVTVEYDPELLELLEVLEGELMTGACGNTFFLTAEDVGEVTVTHVILCGQNPAALDGPGTLCLFRFRGLAEGISPVEITSDPDSTFADAGTPLNPEHPTFPRQVVFHDATVRITEQTAVVEYGPAGRIHLEQNTPNPFNPTTTFRYRTAASGRVKLEILDARGRLVWQRAWDRQPAGTHTVRWQAMDRDGRPLASGVYFYRLTTPAASIARKMTLVR